MLVLQMRKNLAPDRGIAWLGVRTVGAAAARPAALCYLCLSFFGFLATRHQVDGQVDSPLPYCLGRLISDIPSLAAQGGKPLAMRMDGRSADFTFSLCPVSGSPRRSARTHLYS